MLTSEPPAPKATRRQDLYTFSHPSKHASSEEVVAAARDRWKDMPMDLDQLRPPRAGINLAAVQRHRTRVRVEQQNESERLLRSLSESGIRISAPVVRAADRTPTAHRPHTDRTPTAHRPHTDHTC